MHATNLQSWGGIWQKLDYYFPVCHRSCSLVAIVLPRVGCIFSTRFCYFWMLWRCCVGCAYWSYEGLLMWFNASRKTCLVEFEKWKSGLTASSLWSDNNNHFLRQTNKYDFWMTMRPCFGMHMNTMVECLWQRWLLKLKWAVSAHPFHSLINSRYGYIRIFYFKLLQDNSVCYTM